MRAAYALRIAALAALAAYMAFHFTETGDEALRAGLWGLAAGMWTAVIFTDRGAEVESND